MTILRFTVPGAPHPKARHRYRILQRKGTYGTNAKDYFAMEYPDTDTEREEARIAAYCQRAMAEQHFDKVESGPVALFVLAVFKIPASVSKKEMDARIWHGQRCDVDNVLKLAADAMNGIAWSDDAQVGSVQGMKVWSLTEQFVEIVVVKLDDRDSSVSSSWGQAKELSVMMTDRAREVSMAGREQQIGMEGVG